MPIVETGHSMHKRKSSVRAMAAAVAHFYRLGRNLFISPSMYHIIKNKLMPLNAFYDIFSQFFCVGCIK